MLESVIIGSGDDYVVVKLFIMGNVFVLSGGDVLVKFLIFVVIIGFIFGILLGNVLV